MLQLQHGKARRIAGIGLVALLSGGGLLLAQPVAAQDSQPKEERIQIRHVVTDGKENGDTFRRALPKDLEARMAKCDGEKFEADTGAAPAGDKKARSRILICAKTGSSEADTAAALERVLGRVEGTNDMPAENKAQIVARLKARIAELKAGS